MLRRSRRPSSVHEGTVLSPSFRNHTEENWTPWPEPRTNYSRPSDHRMSAKLVPIFADRGVSRGQRDGSLRPYSRISRLEPLPLVSRSSSFALTRLSAPRSRPTASQDIWKRREPDPHLWTCVQALWPLDHSPSRPVGLRDVEGPTLSRLVVSNFLCSLTPRRNFSYVCNSNYTAYNLNLNNIKSKVTY
jgi:hypothetical protein